MTKKKKHEQRSLTDEPAEDELPELGFEEAIGELEALVDELEEGDLSLEDAMARFERGLALVRTCQAKLQQAELRVSELLESGAVEPLEDGDDA